MCSAFSWSANLGGMQAQLSLRDRFSPRCQAQQLDLQLPVGVHQAIQAHRLGAQAGGERRAPVRGEEGVQVRHLRSSESFRDALGDAHKSSPLPLPPSHYTDKNIWGGCTYKLFLHANTLFPRVVVLEALFKPRLACHKVDTRKALSCGQRP